MTQAPHHPDVADQPPGSAGEALAPRGGVTYAPGLCTFGVFAQAEALRVRLTHPGTRETIVREMEGDDSAPSAEGGAMWRLKLPLDLHGWSYEYEVVRDGHTLGGVIDPWATLVREGRAYIVHDTTRVTPRAPFEPRDALIYEIHIRDFTRDPMGGVRPDWRGKYLGLTQSGTVVEGTSYPSGLDHLKELGVTVVQLMPVHSFSLPYHPEYEWGYMPNDFNAPHAGYASSVELDAPIRELKRMVSALHEAQLRVTLDVVYNHTAERWPDRLRSLMALAPREYFRFKANGKPWDGSACGNEFRSDSPQGRAFVVHSTEYWVREFGVDGFRFDLMGLIDQTTMEIVTSRLHAIDPTILVYGEPWAGGKAGIEVAGKGSQRGRGWGVFNDEMRDGLRGDIFEPKDAGFLVAGEDIAPVKASIVGGVASFADGPLETINYLECHDNHTLMDRLHLSAPAKKKFSDEQRLEINALGALILLTSQGIPFLHSGQEFGRTKDLEDNTYNLGDQINNIRWKDKADRYRLFSFYKSVIAMRRAHPMFRLETAEQVGRAIRFLDDDLGLELPGGTIGYLLEDVTGEDTWTHALLLFNGTSSTVTMPLPEVERREGDHPKRRASDRSADGRRAAPWRLFALDGHLVSEPGDHGGSLELRGHFGAVLYVER